MNSNLEKLDKIVKDLENISDEIKNLPEPTEEEKEEIMNDFKSYLEDGLKTPCKVEITKSDSGLTNVKIETTSRLALLITLTNAISIIKERFEISDIEWYLIDGATNQKDVEETETNE